MQSSDSEESQSGSSDYDSYNLYCKDNSYNEQPNQIIFHVKFSIKSMLINKQKLILTTLFLFFLFLSPSL